MSMYNLVMGDGREVDRVSFVLNVIGLEPADCGRLRDAWFERWTDGEQEQIVAALYTRNGGGNREHYDDNTDEGPWCNCTGCIAEYRLPAQAYYLRDADDEFDSTYATFYFAVPAEHVAVVRDYAGEPINMSERWLAAIESIKASVDKQVSGDQ